MSPLFDDLEEQLRDAAQRKARPAARWLRAGARALPLGLAAAVVVGVVAVVLAGHGRSGTSTSAPAPGSPQSQRDAAFIQRATGAVQRSAVCRARRPVGPNILHGSPSGVLLGELAVLRRPATAADRESQNFAQGGSPTVYGGAARRAQVDRGVSYYVVPVRDDPGAGQPTDRCLQAQEDAVKRAAASLSAAERASATRTFEAFLNADRQALDQPPQDGVCVATHWRSGGGQSCTITATELQRGAIEPAITSGDTYGGVVPDQVASVTLRFAASGRRAARSATVPVRGNVYVAHVRGVRGEPTVIWRDRRGRQISMISGRFARQQARACLKRPARCLLEGSTSEASSSSASATATTSSTR